LLDHPQVGAALEQVSGDTVPQPVRAEIRGVLHVLEQRVHDGADLTLVDSSAAPTEEERRSTLVADQLAPAEPKPLLERISCGSAVRHAPLLVALADDTDHPALVIEIVNVQGGELPDTDAGGIQQLEHGSVADVDGILVVTGHRCDLEQLTG